MVFMILLRGSLLVDRVCTMFTGSTVTMGNVTPIQAIHLGVSQCTTNNMSRVYDNPHPLPCCTWVANWDGCVRNISKTMIVKVVLVLTWTKVGWPTLGWGLGSTGGGVLSCLWAQQWSGSVICRWERCSCSYSDAWWHSGVFGVWYLMNITMSVWHRSNHRYEWVEYCQEPLLVLWNAHWRTELTPIHVWERTLSGPFLQYTICILIC